MKRTNKAEELENYININFELVLLEITFRVTIFQYLLLLLQLQNINIVDYKI